MPKVGHRQASSARQSGISQNQAGRMQTSTLPSAHSILQLQRAYGNQATLQLLRSSLQRRTQAAKPAQMDVHLDVTEEVVTQPEQGVIQGMNIMFDYEDGSIANSARIKSMKADQPEKPKTQVKNLLGNPSDDGKQYCHIDAWMSEHNYVASLIEGKTIAEACKEFGVADKDASIAKLKEVISSRLEAFQSDASNYYLDKGTDNQKIGGAAMNAYQVLKGLESKKSANTLTDDEKATYNKSFHKYVFFSSDIPQILDESRKIKKARKLKNRFVKRNVTDASGNAPRIKHVINLPEDLREDYLGKRGKGVKGWTPELIVRDKGLDEMDEGDVSDLETGADNEDLEYYK